MEKYPNDSPAPKKAEMTPLLIWLPPGAEPSPAKLNLDPDRHIVKFLEYEN